jgi:hypothetical protein
MTTVQVRSTAPAAGLSHSQLSASLLVPEFSQEMLTSTTEHIASDHKTPGSYVYHLLSHMGFPPVSSTVCWCDRISLLHVSIADDSTEDPAPNIVSSNV